MLLAERLRCLEPLFANTTLTVDCAFSYLFYNLPDEELVMRGVEGCAMGERLWSLHGTEMFTHARTCAEQSTRLAMSWNNGSGLSGKKATSPRTRNFDV